MVLAASVLVLAGCSAPSDAATDGKIQVVASTSIYGSLAAQIGGGYDAFMTELLDGSDADAITAAKFSHDYPDATVAGSFDHRVIDGDGMSRFVADVASVLKEPALLVD